VRERTATTRPSAAIGNPKEKTVPKFIIERDLPDAGKLGRSELRAIAAKSNGVLRDMAPDVQWLRTFVTGDKLYCEYIASTAEAVREHARRGGFPANRVAEVTTTIDPTTAD
jgi:hypothetical protein